GRAACSGIDEGEHGRADPSLQALHRGHPRSRRRGVRGDRTPEGGVRRLRDFGWRQQAVPDQAAAARLRAPVGTGRDVARPYARRRRRNHRHAGHRVRIDRSMSVAGEAKALSSESIRRIEREVAKYPADQKQSAVMSALAIAQDEHGWLPPEVMDGVAHQLGMPPVAVYEVASFYAMYNLKPTGRFKLTICTNLPCALQGAEAAAKHLKERLGIGFGETTGDGRFTLKEGECMGACGDAPVMLVNNKRMEGFLNPPQMDTLLDELSAAAERDGSAPSKVAPR